MHENNSISQPLQLEAMTKVITSSKFSPTSTQFKKNLIQIKYKNTHNDHSSEFVYAYIQCSHLLYTAY